MNFFNDIQRDHAYGTVTKLVILTVCLDLIYWIIKSNRTEFSYSTIQIINYS